MLAQGVGSFVVWVLYGVLQARRSAQIRASVGAKSRAVRGLLGAGLIVGGIALLFAGFLLIQSIGGASKSALTPLGWLLATLVGLLFVHCQTMGMAMLVSLALETVSPGTPATSSNQDLLGKTKT